MKAGRDRWFFSGMAAAVIAIVAAGFAPTYYFRPIVAAPALPLSIHVHGALFTASRPVSVPRRRRGLIYS
jgi:hypothetical protein